MGRNILNHVTIFQPSAIENSYSAMQIIHKIVNNVNLVIDEVNSIEDITTERANNYTNEKINELDTSLQTLINSVNENLSNEIENLQNDLNDLSETVNNNYTEFNERINDVVTDVEEINSTITNLTNTYNQRFSNIENDIIDINNLIEFNYNLLLSKINLLEWQFTHDLINHINLISPLDSKKKNIKMVVKDLGNLIAKNGGNNVQNYRIEFMTTNRSFIPNLTTRNTNNLTNRTYAYPLPNTTLKFPSITYPSNFWGAVVETKYYIKDRNGTLQDTTNIENWDNINILLNEIKLNDVTEINILLEQLYLTTPTSNYSNDIRFYKNTDIWLPFIYRFTGVNNNSMIYYFYILKMVLLITRTYVKSIATGDYYSCYDIFKKNITSIDGFTWQASLIHFMLRDLFQNTNIVTIDKNYINKVNESNPTNVNDLMSFIDESYGNFNV